jgi:hypothetical protein
VVVSPPELGFWSRLLKEDRGRIIRVNIRMTHHFINRSLRSLQRVHTWCHVSRRLGFKLVVASHRRNQVQEERDESTTATFLEQDLEGVRRVQGPVLAVWNNRFNISRNVVAVKYGLTELLTVHKQLQSQASKSIQIDIVKRPALTSYYLSTTLNQRNNFEQVKKRNCDGTLNT